MIAYVCTVDVADVDASTADCSGERRTGCRSRRCRYPEMGWLVYCKDTEGNIFGMMQNDPNAQ